MFNINKSVLRTHMKNLRDSMTVDEIKLKSHEIFENLIKLDKYVKAEKVFTYINTKKEVRTEEIVNYSLSNGKKILAPKVMSNNDMNFYPFDNLSNLKIGKFNIYEPEESGIPVVPSASDIIIVPGLGFDLNRNRLGYGGGYYDRFLNKLEKKPIIIALSYDSQIQDKIPIGRYDVTMDLVITEKRIIS